MQMQATRYLLASFAIKRPVHHFPSQLTLRQLHSFSHGISTTSPLRSFSFQSRNLSTQFLTTLDQIKQPEVENSVFIFRSSSTNPYINLSLEHYLLQNAHSESRILFLYVNRPCVVIGRNQNPWVECALQKLSQEPPSAEGQDGIERVQLVRRRSGGGAVFHDEGNLNYSVIVPSHAKAEFKRKTHAEMVVRAVKAVQRDLIAPATPSETPDAAAKTKMRLDTGAVEKMNVRVNERNDIVMDDSQRGILKVSGSAFKLTKGRALHHGTLLFSSPNLKRIGEFLRSPARDFISAKGVESVRSPVGNLFDLPENAPDREILRWRLEANIAAEFRKMYGEEANARVAASKDGSNFTESALSEDIGFQIDESTEAGAEIMKGVREIISPQWKFEQTPGYVVLTKPVESENGFLPPAFPEGVLEGANVFFRVKHGIIQEAELSLSHDEGAVTEEKEQIKPRLQARKLHEISDWKAIFAGLDAWNHADSGRLADWLSKMFPPLVSKPLQGPVLGPSHEKIENETQEGGIFKRQRADGVVEVEEPGERVVDEFSRYGGSRRGSPRR